VGSGGGEAVGAGIPDEAIQVNAAFPLESVLSLTAAQHMEYLLALAESVEAQRTFSHEEMDRLEREILAVQGQLAEAAQGRSRLEVERNLSQELYETLSRSVQESVVAAGGNDDVFIVASPAFTPTDPAGPRKGLIMFIAGCVGLVAGGVSALGLEWWRSAGRLERKEDARSSAESA
jgi:uncharacterized protein involved in exopolysaccharide biosynthesis